MSAVFSRLSPGQQQRISYLIAGYIRQTLTEKEHRELDAWVAASDDNLLLFEDLTDDAKVEESLQFLDQVDTDKALHKVKQRIEFKRSSSRLWWWAAAASVILVLTLVTWKYWLGSTSNAPTFTEAPDLAPGGNRAVLILSDGSSISLDEAGGGLLRTDNGIAIRKERDGLISYKGADQSTGLTAMNTLRTPKGGQYRLQLADGSNVWLNAASSITYPIAFTEGERRVRVEGEAYFEVKHNAAMPFIVELPDGREVKVLGTEFNVQTYIDEPVQEVTLVNGIVELAAAEERITLTRGQQAVIENGKMKMKTGADIEMATAWKNGNFYFRDANMKSIMRQVSRWYDVEVVHEAKVENLFNAEISRDVPVSKLLKLFELTERVNFKIEKDKIYVLP